MQGNCCKKLRTILFKNIYACVSFQVVKNYDLILLLEMEDSDGEVLQGLVDQVEQASYLAAPVLTICISRTMGHIAMSLYNIWVTYLHSSTHMQPSMFVNQFACFQKRDVATFIVKSKTVFLHPPCSP